MSLIKWTPRNSLIAPFRVPSVWGDIDRLLDSFFGYGLDNPFAQDVDWLPAFDVIENDKQYLVRVEAPGMEKSDFTVAVKDGVLTVTGEKKTEKSESDDRYTHRESRYGRFSRSFRLPDEVAEKKVKASYKNGVLTITVPRKKPVATKEIEVEIS